MPDYRDFDRLNTIIRIEGILVNETPLRIGTGKEPPLGAPVDVAVYRVNGIPCIPGSSLKGLFRNYVEMASTSKGVKVHEPWNKDAIEDEAKRGDFCPVCGIFGSTELASHIRVYDAFPKDNRFYSFQKTGTSIDREFGSVRAGSLFTEELITPMTEWTFKMDVINIDLYSEQEVEDKRKELLKSLLTTLTTIGLSIGSRKSVGYGLIKLKEAKWRKYKFVEGELKLVDKGDAI
ncbi:MAG: RAMP superfamily CRISPR-associated protein [Candidatus Bathyarchaeia archaeon]